MVGSFVQGDLFGRVGPGTRAWVFQLFALYYISFLGTSEILFSDNSFLALRKQICSLKQMFLNSSTSVFKRMQSIYYVLVTDYCTTNDPQT